MHPVHVLAAYFISVYECLSLIDGTRDGDLAQHLIWTTLTSAITVSCGVPPHVESSEVQMTGILQDDIAIYQCQLGFRREGNSTAVCKHDGKWTQPPRCQGDIQMASI